MSGKYIVLDWWSKRIKLNLKNGENQLKTRAPMHLPVFDLIFKKNTLFALFFLTQDGETSREGDDRGWRTKKYQPFDVVSNTIYF
jgi:hypothetical protein